MESGMRLIAFGCSQTYGHCLPDAFVEDKSAWDRVGIADNPSKHAFPQLIGNYLDLETVNKSWPGCSNRNIWYNAVNFDFQPDDMVIFVWTLPNRSMIVRKDKTVHHLGTWPSPDKIHKAYQKLTAISNSELDLEIAAFHLIDHANLYVKEKVKKVLHYKLVKANYESMPTWTTFEFQNSLDFIIPHTTMDYALDNQHYGIESHKSIARQMIQDLTIDSN